ADLGSRVHVVHFGQAGAIAGRPGESGAVAATAAGLLWCVRRTARPRADRCGRGDAAATAARDDRAGGDDRSGRVAHARQDPSARSQTVRGAARLCEELPAWVDRVPGQMTWHSTDARMRELTRCVT